MSDQKKKNEQLKQQVLDQIQTQQEAIESLSEEELESVAGGFMTTIANINTGVARPYPIGPNAQHGNIINTTEVIPSGPGPYRNINTGAMMPNRILP